MLDDQVKQLQRQWLADYLRPYGDNPALASYFSKELRRCNSTQPKTFGQWFRKKLTAWEFHYTLPTVEGEQPAQPVDFEYSIADGVLSITIGEHEGQPIVWRVPERHLDFVQRMLPVYAKKLAPLETPERQRLRELKADLKGQHKSWHGCSPFTRDQFEEGIKTLEADLLEAEKTPLPARFAVWKSVDGTDKPVHAMYLNDDEVGCRDGDFTNYGLTKIVTERRRHTYPPFLPPEGVPLVSVEETWEPNIFVLGSAEDPYWREYQARKQAKHDEFNRSMQQIPRRTNADGVQIGGNDIQGRYKQKIYPNQDLGKRVGYYGEIKNLDQIKGGEDTPEADDHLLQYSLPRKGLTRDVSPIEEVNQLAARLTKAWKVGTRLA